MDFSLRHRRVTKSMGHGPLFESYGTLVNDTSPMRVRRPRGEMQFIIGDYWCFIWCLSVIN